jgi:hypothetical protein
MEQSLGRTTLPACTRPNPSDADKKHTVLVFCGSRAGRNPRFSQEARRLGRRLGEAGYGIVTGGSQHGLMGAVTDGALEAGVLTTGFVPVYIASMQETHSALERTVVVDSLADRKTMMFNASDICVALPGAIGTMDEIMETLVLRELKQHPRPVVVIDIERYWEPMFTMLERMVEQEFLPAILDSIVVRVNSAEAAVQAVSEQLATPVSMAHGG